MMTCNISATRDPLEMDESSNGGSRPNSLTCHQCGILFNTEDLLQHHIFQYHNEMRWRTNLEENQISTNNNSSEYLGYKSASTVDLYDYQQSMILVQNQNTQAMQHPVSMSGYNEQCFGSYGTCDIQTSSEEIWDMDSNIVRRYAPPIDNETMNPNLHMQVMEKPDILNRIQTSAMVDFVPFSSSPENYGSTSLRSNFNSSSNDVIMHQNQRGLWRPMMHNNSIALGASSTGNEVVKKPKSFQCESCDKWFTSSGHLKRHYNTTLHKNALRQKSIMNVLPDNNKTTCLPSSYRHCDNYVNENANSQSGYEQSTFISESPTLLSDPSSSSLCQSPNSSIIQLTTTGNANRSSPVTQFFGDKFGNVRSQRLIQTSYSPSKITGVNMPLSPTANCMSPHVQVPSSPCQQQILYHNQNHNNPVQDCSLTMINNSSACCLDELNAIKATDGSTVDYMYRSSSGGSTGTSDNFMMTSSPSVTYNHHHVSGGNTYSTHEIMYGMQQTTSASSPVTFASNYDSSYGGLPNSVNLGGHTEIKINEHNTCISANSNDQIATLHFSNNSVNQPMYNVQSPAMHNMSYCDAYGNMLSVSGVDNSVVIIDQNASLNQDSELEIGDVEKSAMDYESLTDKSSSALNNYAVIIGEDAVDASIAYRCKECKKSFNKMCYLKQHNKTFHSGEKPFKCDQCGKRFTADVLYKEHLAKHIGDKPYKCEVCPKQFNHKTDLRRHMCLHTGEKPFSCEECGKGFIREDRMVKHADTHKKRAMMPNLIPS